MKIVAEMDPAGKVVRIFHRNANSAWTHAPGDRYRYRTRTRGEDGRNVLAWRELRCDCPVRESAGDAYRSARRSSAPKAATGVPEALVGGGPG
jgi:hypothetical protein